MTLYEFKLQASKGWTRFIFLSENQPEYKAAAPVKLDLLFYQMMVSHTPELCSLYFQGNCGWLRIDCVEQVNVKPHVLGDVLEVRCMDGDCFTIIAQ